MNNRQAGGRRRGRNNNSNRNQSNRGGGGADRDNRIDNRARGNAAQMLDKYKKMAQDAQVNGDRVNAEYYHQFADHYFRVNADTQARREEQRLAREEQQRGQNTDHNDARDDRDEQQDGEREDRSSRGRQQRKRGPRADAENEEAAASAGQDSEKAEAPVKKTPVRARRPRKPADVAAESNGEPNGLDVSALPPAISIKPDDDEVEVEKKPVRKRRTVKAKAAEEGDAA
jgi:hypothetical protein